MKKLFTKYPIRRKMLFLLILYISVSVYAVAQEPDAQKGDFWLCPSAEAAMYSFSEIAFGGGFALGYGKGVSVGIKAAYFIDKEELSTMELCFLLRYYFLHGSHYGPFIQFNGGPALFNQSSVAIPARVGTVSVGLSLGWRFLLGKLWFVEPNLRFGYPYFAGASFSAGIML